MLKISGHPMSHALHSVAATRALEEALASTLAPHTLMARAATAAATLAKAIAPHAHTVWVACGPGNNGGDGLLTAALLAPWLTSKGGELTVTWCGDEHHMPADARWALGLARLAGVRFVDTPPARCDLTIDALLGIGAKTHAEAPASAMPSTLQRLLTCFREVGDRLLCLDIPSDLQAETGKLLIANKSINISGRRTFCLTFLTIKPGLFTAHGRDAAGEVWFDDLSAGNIHAAGMRPIAQLSAAPGSAGPAHPTWQAPMANSALTRQALHATHKGDFGDVWVVGGQGMSAHGHAMTGAILLAGRAALHAGAGRVCVVPLGHADSIAVDMVCPELMFRQPHTLLSAPLPDGVWVCGCGGGQAVVPYLPHLLQQARVLVLDADALNAIANDAALQKLLMQRAVKQNVTVMTPHPLEAARLLGTSTAQVQHDRLSAAAKLVAQYGCLCVLKGSGSIIAGPGRVPAINPTGNAKLSTAGTGDVLAGMLGAHLARKRTESNTVVNGTLADSAAPQAPTVFDVVCNTVWAHGHAADCWPVDAHLSASQLAMVGDWSQARLRSH